MKKKKIIMAATLIWFVCSLAAGVSSARTNQCTYTTIASRINLAYVVGCELNRVRFKPYSLLIN